MTYMRHVHHGLARAWFDGLDMGARVSFCRLTQISLLRLLTTQAVMGADVMTQDQAWGAYDLWHEDERVVFLNEPPGVEETFRSLSRHPSPKPKAWADAYLAAFALAADIELVTFDAGFRSFPGLRRSVLA